MKKHLYFICPTDCLETIINSTFRDENYYCTSLGNSITFDRMTVGQIKNLLAEHRISECTFVLSSHNRIVADALGNQDYTIISELINFYNQITDQRTHLEMSWKKGNTELMILSNHLNAKIRELKHNLDQVASFQPKLSAKIYDRQKQVFIDTYSDLIRNERFALN